MTRAQIVQMTLDYTFVIWCLIPREWTKRKNVPLVFLVPWALVGFLRSFPGKHWEWEFIRLASFVLLAYSNWDDWWRRRKRIKALILGALTEVQSRVMQRHTREALT